MICDGKYSGENIEKLSSEEIEIIRLYRNCDNIGKEAVSVVLKSLTKSYDNLIYFERNK